VPQSSARSKLIACIRCFRAGVVKRDCLWLCDFHDPGPNLRRVSLWLANVEATIDLDEEAARAESRRNRRWWKDQQDECS